MSWTGALREVRRMRFEEVYGRFRYSRYARDYGLYRRAEARSRDPIAGQLL